MKYQSILFVSFLFIINTSYSQHIFPYQEEKPIWNISSNGILAPLDDHRFIDTRPDTLICGITWTPIQEHFVGTDFILPIGYYRVDSTTQKVFYKPDNECSENNIFLLYDFSASEGDIIRSRGLISGEDSTIIRIVKIDTVNIAGANRRLFNVAITYSGLKEPSVSFTYFAIDTWIEGIGSINYPFGYAEFIFKSMLPLKDQLLRCLQKNNQVFYQDEQFPYCLNPSSNIIYVDSSNTSSFQDGRTWSSAFNDLKEALQIATPEDSIWIAEGTYFPNALGNRIQSFKLSSGIKIFGGFKNTFTRFEQRNPEEYRTILSGDIGVNGDSTDNSFHVLRLDLDTNKVTVLDGLVIEGGYARVEDNSNTSSFVKGGGVLIDPAENIGIVPVIINHCEFRDNFAFDGGAIYSLKVNETTVMPQIHNSKFFNNHSTKKGGAIFYQSGVGEQKVEIVFLATQFINNSSKSGGGAVFIEKAKPMELIINTCSFIECQSFTNGGGVGVFNFEGGLDAKILGSKFNDNQGDVGGAYSIIHFLENKIDTMSLRVENSEFQNNSAQNEGGAIGWLAFSNISKISISNSTFSNNYAFLDGGAIFLSEDTDGSLDLSISESEFIKNTTINGFNGGVYYRTEFDSRAIGDFSIVNSMFINNSGALGMNSGRLSQFLGNFVNCTFQNNGSFPILKSNSALFTDSIAFCDVNIYNSILWEPQTDTIPILGNGDFNNPTLLGYQLENNIFSSNFRLGRPGQADDFLVSNLLVVDPFFTDPNLLDFSLRSCSPAINRGNNDWLAPYQVSSDLAGNVRVQEERIDIGAFEQPELKFELLNKKDILCSGEKNGQLSFITENIQVPFDISWNEKSVSNQTTINNLSSGQYQFILSDSQGCIDSVSLTLSQPDSLHAEWVVKNIGEGEENTGAINLQSIQGGTPPYAYLWNTGAISSSIDGLPLGDYQVEVVDSNQCQSLFDFMITLVTSTQNMEQVPFNVFPNPASDFIQIEGENLFIGDELDVLLFSMEGKKVMEKRGVLLSEKIDIEHLIPGTYFLTFFNEEGQQTIRFVKQ